jgi:hypothetical protein
LGTCGTVLIEGGIGPMFTKVVVLESVFFERSWK